MVLKSTLCKKNRFASGMLAGRSFMAKDGTNRGGKRPGAGRKRKPLAEKIQEGQKAIALAMPEQDDLDGEDVESIRE